MAKSERASCSLRPSARSQIKDVQVVIDTAGDIEGGTGRIKGDAVISVRHLKHLFFDRHLVRDVINKYILVSCSGHTLAGLRIIQAGITRSQDQQGLVIGADYSGCGLTGARLRELGQSGFNNS